MLAHGSVPAANGLVALARVPAVASVLCFQESLTVSMIGNL